IRTPKDSRRLWYRRSSLPAMCSIAVVVKLIRLKMTMADSDDELLLDEFTRPAAIQDRKSTRLNSSHDQISYAVFCLKKKKCISLAYVLPAAHIAAPNPPARF